MKRMGIMGVVICAVLCASTMGATSSRPPEPRIQVEFDTDQIVAGRPFRISVSVTADGQEAPRIDIPRSGKLEVLDESVSRPASSYSFSFSFGTGQGSQKVVRNTGTWVHTLTARARTPGRLTFGPVKVELDGHTFTGRTYPLEVLDATAAGQVSGDAVDAIAQTMGSRTELTLKNVKIDPDYFLHMIPSREECLLGELIILDIYLFTSVSGIRADQFEREPGTEGFWVERFEDVDVRRGRHNRRVVLNGKVYDQVLLNRFALFPLKTGALTITPAVFTFSVGGGGFFSLGPGKMVRRAAQPVTIRVNPLPTAGRAARFEPANVGRYHFDVSVSSDEVQAGEPLTVTLTARGTGNVRNVVLPMLDPIAGVRMYPPELDAEVRVRDQSVSGMRQSRILLIPSEEGILEIPSIRWSFLDPETEKYVKIESESLRVKVNPGPGGHPGGAVVIVADGSSPAGDAMERMNRQMRTLHSRTDITMSGGPLLERLWFYVLVVLLPLFVGIAALVRFGRRKWQERHANGRAARAFAVARRSMKELEKTAEGMPQEACYGALQKVLTTFIADRLEESVAADTMSELQERLLQLGVQRELVVSVASFLEECEFARFARSSGALFWRSERDRMNALLNDLLTALPSPEKGAER